MKPWARFLLPVAVATYLVAAVLWVGVERRSPRQFLDPGSALNDGEHGASLARAYLQASPGSTPGHPRVGLLTRPIVGGEVAADAVVFRLVPALLPWSLPPRETKEKPKDKAEEKSPAKSEAKPGAPPVPTPAPSAPPGKDATGSDAQGTEEAAGDDDEEDDDDEDEGIVLAPNRRPGHASPLLTLDEEEWVRGGGRLVLAITDSYGPLWAAEPKRPAAAPVRPITKVFPLWPAVVNLRPPVRRGLHGPALGLAHSVFLVGEEPLVARLSLGRGDLVLLACPEVFENSRLAVGDHLALLAALAGAPGRPVLFDERVHGSVSETGIFSVLAGWGLGPALVLAALAALAVAARHAIRLGPPDRDPGDTRSDAVDLVDSLGALYDRALSRGDAIRLYWEGFVHTVAVDSGLSGVALAARAHELAGGFVPPAPGENLSRQAFDGALAKIHAAKRRARDGQFNRLRGDGE